MGLFDLFKGDSGTAMTPHLAFAISLVYMIGIDGKVENEEVGQLLAVLGGESSGGVIGVGANNRQLLDNAFKYTQRNSPDTFLSEVSAMLTDAQKMCILTNLIDSSLSDGEPAPEEQRLFNKFLEAFGISEARFRPFFEVIALKNDRSVFTNQNHPKNQTGYEVHLLVHDHK
ncbi:MAG: TerB family tellurite resistance protein [Thiotrichaceae bacterium]